MKRIISLSFSLLLVFVCYAQVEEAVDIRADHSDVFPKAIALVIN
ncbi:MAG TPA: hypothetical protein VJ346_07365 [Bacteroidales bacterium]|nr:hypothetical protein [Bacteroidales bacterium]